MLAELNSFPYKVVLVLHVLAVIVAFAPAFVWPVVRASLRRQGEEALPAPLTSRIVKNDMYIHGPALVIAGALGVVLVLLSDEVWEFSQRWVSVAFVLWFLMLGVLFAGLIPAERKAAMPDAPPNAESRASMFGGMLHLLLLLQLVVMVWGPR